MKINIKKIKNDYVNHLPANILANRIEAAKSEAEEALASGAKYEIIQEALERAKKYENAMEVVQELSELVREQGLEPEDTVLGLCKQVQDLAGTEDVVEFIGDVFKVTRKKTKSFLEKVKEYSAVGLASAAAGIKAAKETAKEARK